MPETLIFRAGFAFFAFADFFGFRFAISTLRPLAETPLDDFAHAFKFHDCLVDRELLHFQPVDLIAKTLRGDGELCRLPVAEIVEIEHSANFLQRKAYGFAEEHKLQPRTVAAAVNAILSVAPGREQLTLLIETERARGDAEFARQIANAKRLLRLALGAFFGVEV